jgi:polysaccharide export outer membrane protein
VRPDYILGPNDQILIRSNAEEISGRPYRVDQDGYLNLPLLERVPVTGLTVAALERDLIARLRMFLVAPEVTITVTAFRNEPVSFLGAFIKPGIYTLTGNRTLVEMLAVVGGFQPNASRRLRITRPLENGPIPLPGAIEDPIAKTSTVEIELTRLTQELNPIEDIELKARDRVFVDVAPPVYIGGEVTRPAPVDLGARDYLTVMQALTQVGGFTGSSKRKTVHVLRPVTGPGKVARIDVDVRRIINGEDNDFPLYANDILYVDRVSPFVAIIPNAIQSALTSLPYAIITALIIQ